MFRRAKSVQFDGLGLSYIPAMSSLVCLLLDMKCIARCCQMQCPSNTRRSIMLRGLGAEADWHVLHPDSETCRVSSRGEREQDSKTTASPRRVILWAQQIGCHTTSLCKSRSHRPRPDAEIVIHTTMRYFFRSLYRSYCSYLSCMKGRRSG